MKKLLCVLLSALFVLSLASCNKTNGFNKDGWKDMLDAAIKLPTECTRELLDKVNPPEETDFYIKYYKEEKNQDYLAELANQFKDITDRYTEDYGADWKLSYTVLDVQEKDAEGIANYKSYDGYYFRTYGIDTDKIQAVTFVKVNVHMESSSYTNDKEKTLQCFCIGGVWYSFYGAMLGTKL